MLIIFPGLRGPQRVAAGGFVVAAMALVIVESLDAPVLPAELAMIVSGLLAVTVLLLAEARPLTVGVAATVSITVSVACCLLPAMRPEHTFGLVEFGALSFVVIRLVMQHRLRRAAAPALLTMLAIGLLPVRALLHPANWWAMSPNGGGAAGLVAVALAGWVVFLAVLGLYLRLLEHRRADSDRLARQAERLDYARDLHDYVAHHVTAIVAQTRAIRFVTSSGASPSPGDLDLLLAGVEDAGAQALVSMRTLVGVLRDDVPMAASAHQTLDEMLTAVVAGLPPGQPAPAVDVDASLSRRPLPAASLDAAHHTVLEALTNVLRHTAGARTEIRVRVHPDRPGFAEVTVHNNTGAEVSPPLPAGGFGLMGLSERVQAAGGELTAGPVASGWQVTAVLPLTVRTSGERRPIRTPRRSETGEQGEELR